MNWTQEQNAIFANVLGQEQMYRQKPSARQSFLIEAKAGSAKSTVCREVIKIVSELGASVAYAMFTRDTVDDFKEKFGVLNNVDVNTAHSYGMRALKQAWPSAKMEKGKVEQIVFRKFGNSQDVKKQVSIVTKLVGLAKNAGMCILMKDRNEVELGKDRNYVSFESLIDHHGLFDGIKKNEQSFILEKARYAFEESIRDTTCFDFDDMVYLPLYYNKPFPQYDYVIVDEAQDTNALRCILYRRMLKPWGCLFIVGDESQAIMGFTGADTDAMNLLSRSVSEPVRKFTLSTCFRCSLAVIELAQTIEPNIRARADAPTGVASKLTYEAFLRAIPNITDLAYSSVLCRMNAPNVKLAFLLLRRGIPCRIEGRDIGYGLLKLIEDLEKKVGPDKESVLLALEDWYKREVEKAINERKLFKLDLLDDKYSCVVAVLEATSDLKEAKAKIKLLFSDVDRDGNHRQVLTLSSVHKSKGREWPTVYLLASDALMPSPRATSPWQLKQEHNLLYVAYTRAQHSLIKITKVPLK